MTETEAESIRAEERQRFRTILGSPEAEGREAQARELAFGTNLSAETAVAIMKAAPRANGDAAMFLAGKEAQASLSLDPDTGAAAGSQADAGFSWDSIVANLNAELAQQAPAR